jgi:hypothetical protein
VVFQKEELAEHGYFRGTWENRHMTKRDFVILCLRLLAIFFIVLGLGSLSTMTSMFIESVDDMRVHLFVAPFIYVMSGLVIYVYAPKLCHFVVEFGEAEPPNVEITTSEKTTRIALLILGVYIFAETLPQFVSLSIDVVLYYKSIDEGSPYLGGVQHRWTYVIGPIIKLIIAAVLIIGPDKAVGLLGRYDETFRRVKSPNKGGE